jgi:hypothetical protein
MTQLANSSLIIASIKNDWSMSKIGFFGNSWLPDSVAAALTPRLKGLNITTYLLQVGKVVTGQQL